MNAHLSPVISQPSSACGGNPRSLVVALFIVMACGSGASADHVDTGVFDGPLTATAGRSRITFNPEVQEGLSEWSVAGENLVSRQSLWFRVGDSREYPINDVVDGTASGSADGDESATGEGFIEALWAGHVEGVPMAHLYTAFLSDDGTANGPSALEQNLAFANLSEALIEITVLQLVEPHDTEQWENAIVHEFESQISLDGEGMTEPVTPVSIRGDYDALASLLSDQEFTPIENGEPHAGGSQKAFLYEWTLEIPPDSASTRTSSGIFTTRAILIPEPSTTIMLCGLIAAVAGKRQRL